MPTKSQKRALLIAGPTASGKSALALEKARAGGGVIINADSMQVYRDLRILSARPTPEDEAQAPHRLYGHVSAHGDYSVGQWLADVKREIDDCWREGYLPIIVGGTGLYFRALTQGLVELPEIAAHVREKWRSFDGDLQQELAQRDAEAAARLHPSDRQRLIRALEVIDGTGLPLSHWQRKAGAESALSGVDVERVFVDVPRNVLYERAERRFDKMMEEGALDEVAGLANVPDTKPVTKAIGVPELRAYLRGDTTLEDAVRDAKTATRNYIKRQLTWWRGHMKDWALARPPTP